jgi:hypothetical protein
MYKNGFVVAVKINDKSVEEKDNKVILPFDSEYTLMLKNKNDRKAVARVFIDDEEATEKGRLIIDANGVVNLERFIDDINKGKRFKFVPISNNAVKDKGSSEKGFIEVHFQLVKPVVNNVVIHEHHYRRYRPFDFYYSDGPFYVDYDFPVFGSSKFLCSNSGGGTGMSMSAGSKNFTLNSYETSELKTTNEAFIQDNHLVEERGATIKGSNSSQKFCYSYVGELEAQETIIRFQLVGTRDSKIADQYLKTHCTQCGKAYDINDVYCAKCGTKK